MPELTGILGFGAPKPGVAPYAELAEPKSNVIDRWLERIEGYVTSRSPLYRRALKRRAQRVLQLEPRFREMSDAQLQAAAAQLRPRLLARRGAEPHLSEAFAIVREASRRVLGKQHYPVQIMGALALFDGRMVEMATGEGKTLTATPAAVVAALSGEPVHVVTVNDYLAERDADENRPLYAFFGLTCGVIDSDMDPHERSACYRCDIAYASNSNLTFDYLRDRIALQQRRGLARRKTTELLARGEPPPLMLRGLTFAIVDEADSVFIDEARTPLILSGGGDDPEAEAQYLTALRLASGLREGRDFELDLKNRHVTLKEGAKAGLDRAAAGLTGIWAVRKAREELVTQALSALHLFANEREYIIDDDAVQIVDEYTGRVMPDRTWQGGLHQLIEAKENVGVTARKQTLARITYQRFFRRYLRLSGMTGTGLEVAGEFRDTYGLLTVRLPTHRKRLRRHLRTRFVHSQEKKWATLAETVLAIHKRGQPVLVGTRSVEASEDASRALTKLGVVHEVLNARQDADEANVVAAAGQRGAVTVATNIAGRGTDIRLGKGVTDLGGLHVILTEFHESNRIDRQLFGRAGRQGDPGTTEALVALDDEIFLRFAPRLAKFAQRVPLPPICRFVRLAAQWRAEREHSKTRREQTKIDRDLERSMAFSGAPE